MLAIVGDDGMQMNGNSELLTSAVLKWRKNPTFVVVVLANHDEPGELGAARAGRRSKVSAGFLSSAPTCI